MDNKRNLDLDIKQNNCDSSKDLEVIDKHKNKEYIQKLKDKYGSQFFQSEEESSENDSYENESSDENSTLESDVEHEKIFDEKFLRVYGALKVKDPSIYNENVPFYNEDDTSLSDENIKESENEKHKKSKNDKIEKIDLFKYHKKLLKEKKGITAEDEELINEPNFKTDLGYYEELRLLKQDFLQAAQKNDNDNDDLIIGKKIIDKDENEKLNMKKLLDENKNDKYIEKLNHFWKSDCINENDKFLRDFIINKTYLSSDECSIGDDDNSNDNKRKKKNEKAKKNFENFLKEENEKDEDEYDSDNSLHRKLIKKYEKTNFHHEEPNADIIKRFPRQIESIRNQALKQKNSSKRKELLEHKKKKKDIELKKLRESKREEIKQKIEFIGKTAGINLKNKFKEIDLDLLVDDTDFDAKNYDEKMKELFGDIYYETEDVKKPVFEYDSEIDNDNNLGDLNQDLVKTNEQFDNEMLDNHEQESKNNLKKGNMKKKIDTLDKKLKHDKKNKEKFNGILKKKNFGIYEDIIDGQGIRFKYRKANPASFGLTCEEILLADDKELNKWCSLKKTQSFDVCDQESKSFDRRGQNFILKRKILKSLYGDSDEEKKEFKNNSKKKSKNVSKNEN